MNSELKRLNRRFHHETKKGDYLVNEIERLKNSVNSTEELNKKLLDENTKLKLELEWHEKFFKDAGIFFGFTIGDYHRALNSIKNKKPGEKNINDLVNWAQNNGLGYIHASDLKRFADKCLTMD